MKIKAVLLLKLCILGNIFISQLLWWLRTLDDINWSTLPWINPWTVHETWAVIAQIKSVKCLAPSHWLIRNLRRMVCMEYVLFVLCRKRCNYGWNDCSTVNYFYLRKLFFEWILLRGHCDCLWKSGWSYKTSMKHELLNQELHNLLYKLKEIFLRLTHNTYGGIIQYQLKTTTTK